MKFLGTLIYGSVCSAGMLGAGISSSQGYGVRQPEKSPVSVKEQSVRTSNGTIVRRRRYFTGGGIHSGK